jgi:hypothetical protein
MKRLVSLFAVATCAFFTTSAWPEDGDAMDVEKQSMVSMSLTRLDVNDLGIQLGWTIRNNTDHDVWLCDSMTPGDGQAYEYFLDKDGETLVVRRRFGLPVREQLKLRYPPLQSRYVRLGSGQEKAESFSLATPIVPFRFSAGESGNAQHARSLALEIGFYDEDLPGLILRIVELAERINCDLDVEGGDLADIADRFFSGWGVAKIFKHGLGFSGSVRSDDDRVNLRHVGNGLDGEQVLRIEVAGVRVSYHDWDAEDQWEEAD